MKQTVLRHLLLMVAVAFLTGSPINAALNRIEDSSNVVQARTNVQTTTDWDDQAWREQSLFTLLSFVNEHPDQETCDKARRFLENNPQWFIENMRTILSDIEQTESFLNLLKNNDLCVLLLADLFIKHFDDYRDAWCMCYFLQEIAYEGKQLFIEQIIIPVIPQDIFTVSTSLVDYISDDRYASLIVKQLLKLEKLSHFVMGCIIKMIEEQPDLFINYLILEDRCRLISTIDFYYPYYRESLQPTETSDYNHKEKIGNFISNNLTSIVEFPDGLKFVLLFFGTIFPLDLNNIYFRIMYHVDRKIAQLSQDDAFALLLAASQATQNNHQLQKKLATSYIGVIESISEALDKTNNNKLSFEHVIQLTELLDIHDTLLHTMAETLIDMHIEKATGYLNSSESSLEECGALLRILSKHQRTFNLHIDLKSLTNAFLHKMIPSDYLNTSGIYCSPSIKHIAAMGVHVFESQKKFISNPKLITVLQRISAKEDELNSKGYYTFVHGQRWRYQLVEEWFTKLWQIINSKKLDNFIFAHVRSLDSPAGLLNQSVNRELLLRRGRINKVYHDCSDRELLLFMNAGLFYNDGNIGSNTAYYFSNNDNVNTHLQIGLHDAFKLHGLESCYQNYHAELEQLATEHAQLSEHGNLLLIAIPQNIINQCVYAAWPGGGKKWVTIKDYGQTQNIAYILDTLRNDPEQIENFDYNEFCLVMTTDEYGGLNPESGIKFFQFNTVEPERWQAFKEKEQPLFDRIAHDIQQNRMRKAQDQRSLFR